MTKDIKHSTDAVPGLLRRINIRRVLDVMQKVPEVTRAAITRETGISAPTVSKLMIQLVKAGLVEDSERTVLTAGRPGRVYNLARKYSQIMGIVIDINSCRILTTGLDAKPCKERQTTFPTSDSYDALLDQLQSSAKNLLTRHPGKCLGIGVSVPGLVDSGQQRIAFSPNIKYLNGRQPAKDLAKALGFPCVLIQEEHGLCLAEQRYGLAQNLEDFAMVDVSAGLGMGVVSNNQLLDGCQGYGGELGHITANPGGRLCGCGRRGCLETIASDTAIASQYSDMLGKKISIDEVISEIQNGQLNIEEPFEQALQHLGIGLGIVINLFNPKVLFVHGHFFDAEKKLFDRLIESLREYAIEPNLSCCTIQRARGSKRLGALAVIIQVLCDQAGPTLQQSAG